MFKRDKACGMGVINHLEVCAILSNTMFHAGPGYSCDGLIAFCVGIALRRAGLGLLKHDAFEVGIEPVKGCCRATGACKYIQKYIVGLGGKKSKEVVK